MAHLEVTLVILGLFGCVVYAMHKQDGHTYHAGACPVLKPRPGLKIKNMLGLWVVMERTSTESKCTYNTYTKTESEKIFMVEEKSADKRSQSLLIMKNFSEPGQITVQYPFNIAGLANYTILDTNSNYEDYAVIFTCQNLGLINRRSISILSRHPWRFKMFKEKSNSILTLVGLNPEELDVVTNEHCSNFLRDARTSRLIHDLSGKQRADDANDDDSDDSSDDSSDDEEESEYFHSSILGWLWAKYYG